MATTRRKPARERATKSRKGGASAPKPKAAASKPRSRSPTRERVAPPKTFTPAQQARGAILGLLAQGKTSKVAAKRLGISERTLRRWKNEGKAPSREKAAKVARVFRGLEQAATKALDADRRRHKSAPKLNAKKLPVVPRAIRRKLTVYKTDKRTGKRSDSGERVDSPWINYNVEGWHFSEILSLLTQVWEQGFTFQFIYEIPKGGKYEDRNGKTRVVRKTTRVGTAPIPAYAFEGPEDLADFLSRYIPMDGGGRLARRMIYIAVDEKKLRRR